MKAGDLVRIKTIRCYVWSDDLPEHVKKDNGWQVEQHLGWAREGQQCIFIEERSLISGSPWQLRGGDYSKVVMPGLGPVWVRTDCIEVVEQ